MRFLACGLLGALLVWNAPSVAEEEAPLENLPRCRAGELSLTKRVISTLRWQREETEVIYEAVPTPAQLMMPPEMRVYSALAAQFEIPLSGNSFVYRVFWNPHKGTWTMLLSTVSGHSCAVMTSNPLIEMTPTESI